MRIQNHDIKLNMQGQANQGIISEPLSSLAKMNNTSKSSVMEEIQRISLRMKRDTPFSESNYDTSTSEYKLVDKLATTIFKQSEKIKKLECQIGNLIYEKEMSDYVKNINAAIKKKEKELSLR